MTDQKMQDKMNEIKERMNKMNAPLSDDDLMDIAGGQCGPEPKFAVGDRVAAPHWDFHHRIGTITKVDKWGTMWVYDVHWSANEEGPEEDEAEVWERLLELVKD